MYGSDLSWRLLYTKARAEAWAEANLRRQGFATLMPRVRQRGGYGLLFPRYIFAGFGDEHSPRALQSTRGVLYVVTCGHQPARVPIEVIAEIEARMDAHGVVRLDRSVPTDPLFARRERERSEALVKLAQSGFRVRSA